MASMDKNPLVYLEFCQSRLITASHMLHYHSVLDAYGHISIRHPLNSHLFVMSRSIAPATISSPKDLVTYKASDASPIDPSAPPGYAERHIHSSIYNKHPHINSIVHSHAESVIPFTLLRDIPLKPVYHMAGFLGSSVPVFDIADCFQETGNDPKDMLVRTQQLGDALASHFSTGNNVTLMRGHGFTAIAETIETAVFRAIYTTKNAAIQSNALTLRAAVFGPGAGTLTGSNDGIGEIKYLSDQEATGSTEMTISTVRRPWELWAREVEKSGLYENLALPRAPE
ncbi:arad-like aldolase/epimerase [Rhypophila decipiens]|uniref:Arad-like aldolase/epimerase n=1 Tax=Rhypophila decipiens TaxID=261697 RepID=A0AAN6Y9T8_9PEZI|nr:arad-like aldolase/epimerase [Rhypophila decipiens]